MPTLDAARVAHLMDQECGVRYHHRLLRLGWTSQPPTGRVPERMKPRSGAGNRSAGWRFKKAQNAGRPIVFIGEGGLSQRPQRWRTWVLRGQTSVLQYHFHWKTLSAMAGVTLWNFYFRLFPGRIRSSQGVESLQQLLRWLPGALLITWDGLRSHRIRLVCDFVRPQRGLLWLEFLSSYAREPNPVEYLWGNWKQHELPNLCPDSYGELSYHGRRALRRMRRGRSSRLAPSGSEQTCLLPDSQ